VFLLWMLIGNLDAKPLSLASRALWPGGSAFAAQGSGRPPAPARLAAPPLPPKFPGVAMESCLYRESEIMPPPTHFRAPTPARRC
jgi:hypothetical protein